MISNKATNNARYNFRELRWVIEDELTQVYVLLEALGDCPIGVQGWHHKTFAASKPAEDIWKEAAQDAIMWPLSAPRGWGED